MEYQDEDPVVTEVVIGLTRSPTLWGVPYMVLVLVVIFTLSAWLISKSFWTLLVAPISYAFLFALCAKDARFLEILQVNSAKTPRTKNRAFWGSNSYR